ncbi:MAG: NAD(P)/FAD-dependent oxidoreductase [Chloroflexota bacterium]|nr:NAD(P)/FAD-dependent oxidoreductase [Chloroflexota bacterium]
MSPDVEAIVVGGGPAGSATAAALAEAGHRVLLLDKARFPRHKACSEYINAGGAQVLGEMGVLDEIIQAGAHQMEAMIVHAPSGARFAANFAKAELGRAALGLSRYRLDHILLERARAAGVDVRERAQVRCVVREDGHVVGVEATIDGARQLIRAPLVVGADGHNSVVSRDLGLDVSYRWPDKTGFIAHYRGVTGLDQFGEMHVGHGAYAGLAPLEDGVTNVAVVASGRNVKSRSGSVEAFFSETLQSIPEVAQKLERAERVGGIRGIGSMARRARRTSGDGYLLVGDAASFLDPFTGEGIYEALKAAQLAAPVASAALKAGDVSADALDAYRIARRRSFTAKRQVCWIVQGFVNAPPLMNYVTERLSSREDLGLTLAGVLGNFRPATNALSPVFLARLLRP